VKRLAFFLLSTLLSFSPPLHADIPVDTESLQLRFSDWGDLLSVRACLPACNVQGARVQDYDSYRGFISLNRDSGMAFDMERFDSDHSIDLVFTNLLSNEIRRWRIPHAGWLLGLEVSHPQGMAMTSGEAFFPPEAAGFGAWLESLRYVYAGAGGMDQYGLEEPVGPLTVETEWVGYRNRYWAAMIRPDQQVQAAFRTGEDQPEAQLDLSSSAGNGNRFMVYAGPVEPSALAAAHTDLGALMYSGLWFWLGWICQALFWVLSSIHSLVPNWAISIILLSLLVQLVMRPLNRMAERLQDDVRSTEASIAPRLNAIKKEHKGAEQAERILALYKEENIHPLYSLKAMAGVLVIIPVFIGAFNMLSENIWLSGESFLWIRDLSLPDAVAILPFSIPFLGNGVNLLPFIMVALSIPASMLRNAGDIDPGVHARHTRNLVWMSLVFFLLFYTFPAGMVLYWVVNNLVSLLSSVHQKARA
jgi:YidC/Oxa1 family membrane protein insertase